jgi:hypothetical protein
MRRKACSTHGSDVQYLQNFDRKSLKERDYLKGLGVDRRFTLTWIAKNMAPSALGRDHHLVLAHKTTDTELQNPYGVAPLSERILTYQTKLDSMFRPCAFYTGTCQQLHER